MPIVQNIFKIRKGNIMNSENTFNKPIFAFLLNKAKGDRSINQYADEANISASHISRLLRKLVDSPPTPETISKLALKANNGAGYINAESIEEEYSPQDRQIFIRQTEENFFQIISSYLYNETFQWSIHKPQNKPFYPDMAIDMEHEEYTKWYLEFKPSLDDNKPYFKMKPIDIYGQIAMIELQSTDKFTIVVNSDKGYKNIIQNPPKSLRANLFVMLIDLDERKIIKEEMVCKY
jgi:transcriptional regulator with XRE-family HTH domain